MNKLSLRTLVKNRKKKGFTLVELIIVIAIIAILAAIAIPKFGQITKKSNITADIATAKNLHGIAAQAVADDPALLGTDTDTATTKTAITNKIDGGNMPISKISKNEFKIEIEDDGDIVVSDGTDEVYPNAEGNFIVS
ncbi:prepilin-type N-terminal cleavage/methylation domain-containing protein [Clostridium butyricum]|uniref:Prepilin-type N-terminal cleavage/methylation domain-containing protein n=1 Tax=Clostridium butyricum TaxID=1492 RepID=A0A6L9EMP4_CLOBU|nr:prepilin-type N-terminal cleavage/methylation domain-containing protein [Clostridium butyricum]